jgi:hypothetical protein
MVSSSSIGMSNTSSSFTNRRLPMDHRWFSHSIDLHHHHITTYKPMGEYEGKLRMSTTTRRRMMTGTTNSSSSRKRILSSSTVTTTTTNNNDAWNKDETGTVVGTSPKIPKSSEVKDNDDDADHDKKTNNSDLHLVDLSSPLILSKKARVVPASAPEELVTTSCNNKNPNNKHTRTTASPVDGEEEEDAAAVVAQRRPKRRRKTVL